MDKKFSIVYPYLLILLAVVSVAFAFWEPLQGYSGKISKQIIPYNNIFNEIIIFLSERLTFGIFSFRDSTRFLSWLLTQPLELLQGILVAGFEFRWAGELYTISALPWITVLSIFVLISAKLGDGKLVALTLIAILYLVVFGQWESAALTLASVAVAVPLCVVGGMLLGFLGYSSPIFRRPIVLALDVMQTVPSFAYLVPILVLFGFGPTAGLIATMIYSVPPMTRVTMLALDAVATDVHEFSQMVGCSKWQQATKVFFPASKRSLLLGVNQVIMMCLNMSIIASMIGAGGLGFDVLKSLRSLDIGKGLEAGLAITLIAIVLDRNSQAAAKTTRAKHDDRRPDLGRKLLVVSAQFGGLLVLTLWLARWFPILDTFPHDYTVTTAPFWDENIRRFSINYFDILNSVKYFFVLNIMVPTKEFLLLVPWWAILLIFGLVALKLGGIRLLIVIMIPLMFIVTAGIWNAAIISTYLVGISTVFCVLIGIPIGILMAQSDRFERGMGVILDTIQTLPQFVYLIPVIMLFSVGEFSALIAIVVFSFVPAARYTNLGLRQTPREIYEVTEILGCSRWQRLRKVQLPIAMPEIMMGINQVLMTCLSMLVITALIGTNDLGQAVNTGLGKADVGLALTAGLGVSCIAIVADRLITAFVSRIKNKSHKSGMM